MSENAVPDHLTPCPPAQLYAALRTAWTKLMPTDEVTRAALLVLLSHWALETGFGHYCHCFNLGNLKHVPGDGHDFTMFRCNEVLGGKIVWFDPPAPATWFRAYADLEGGCEDYLVRLRAEFRAAWPFVLAGDVPGFCHALKIAGYYTADEGLYTGGVERCFHQLDGVIPPDAVTEPAGPPDTIPTTGAPDEPHSA